MAKTIGILGGMGPAATIDMLNKIYAHSPGGREQEHVRVLADIDPTVPDRTEAVLHDRGDEVVARLAANARGLVAAGAQLLAIACNTAHAFWEDLAAQVDVPLISMIDVTVADILSRGLRRVGLMATDGALAAGLYVRALKAWGVEVLTPDKAGQSAVMQAIYAYKGGQKPDNESLLSVFNALKAAGAQQVIAACTELPILLAGQEFVDPTDILARELVRLAKSP